MVSDKTRQDNDVTNHIGLVYTKNDTKLLGPIKLGAVSDKTRQDHDVTNLPCAVYTKNEIAFS